MADTVMSDHCLTTELMTLRLATFSWKDTTSVVWLAAMWLGSKEIQWFQSMGGWHHQFPCKQGKCVR